MAVSITEAFKRIYHNTVATATKVVSIEESVGYIIAESVTARHSLPPFDNSAMDGYAVTCADAAKSVDVSHTIFAGDSGEYTLFAHNVYKIMTGAKIPFGCEAVVPIEKVQIHDNHKVTLPLTIKHGEHIRLAGEDIKKGDLLIEKGTKLNAYTIALLASQGFSHITVFAKPRIAVLASGSELKMHFETLQEHQIYNTNTPMLVARCEELHCEVSFIKTAADNMDAITQAITQTLQYDLVITSGGASVGDADFTKKAFETFEFQAIFEKVEIKPGKPTTFGKVGTTYVLNLPGNPLAAALNFELFGKAVIFALSGRKDKFLNTIHTACSKEYALHSKYNTLIPGYFNGQTFTPLTKFAPGMVSPLAKANGFIIAHADLHMAEKVKFLPTAFECTTTEKVDLFTHADTLKTTVFP
jgi:molybdopterin molybdotransferase